MACTYPSIHFSLDEDTLKITVGCLTSAYPSIHKNSQDHGRLSGVWCGVCVWCVVFCLGVVFGRGGVVWVLCVVCVCVCVNRAVNKVSTKSAFEDV